MVLSLCLSIYPYLYLPSIYHLYLSSISIIYIYIHLYLSSISISIYILLCLPVCLEPGRLCDRLLLPWSFSVQAQNQRGKSHILSPRKRWAQQAIPPLGHFARGPWSGLHHSSFSPSEPHSHKGWGGSSSEQQVDRCRQAQQAGARGGTYPHSRTCVNTNYTIAQITWPLARPSSCRPPSVFWLQLWKKKKKKTILSVRDQLEENSLSIKPVANGWDTVYRNSTQAARAAQPCERRWEVFLPRTLKYAFYEWMRESYHCVCLEVSVCQWHSKYSTN